MSSIKQGQSEGIKAQHETLKTIGFTSSLIKEIYVDLFNSNQSLVEFTGDDVNYQTMVSIQTVERYFREQGAIVMSVYESKKFTIAVKI